jgi:hypothetical protein
MNRPVNRITPRLDAQHYQTFQIKAPISTHFVERPCDGTGVNCQAAEHGWKMTLDLKTELGQRQARYIKYDSGRRYEIAEQKDGMVTLVFPGGQPCFATHRVRIDRPEIYAVRGGDFRGNPTGAVTRVHKKPEFWVEEFALNQQKLSDIQKKG